MLKWLLTLPVMLLLSVPALADEKPTEIAPIIKAEQPYGKGSLHKLLWHVYDAELWTDAKPWSYEAPFALSLTYHVAISADDIVDRSLEEMEHIHPLDATEKEHCRSTLKSAFIDVKDGDRITAIFLPNKGIMFYYNGALTTSVASLSFAHQFLDIWLSDKTSDPTLRSHLLAEAPKQ